MLGDLTLALCVLSRFVPIGGALVAIGLIPIAAVASRHRIRAALVGGLAALMVGFLIAGFDMVLTVGGCTLLGTLVGHAYRRGWGLGRTVLVGLVLFWIPSAVGALTVLWVFADLRRLTLDQIRNTWTGLSRTMHDLRLGEVAHVGDTIVTWAIAHWWLVVPMALFALIAIGSALGWLIAHRILGAFEDVRAETPPRTGDDDARPPSPVPVTLERASLRYPAALAWALRDISLTLARDELVAVTGPNGSGKSTLARILVGAEPTEGRVLRSGPAALGRPGGSAIVFQRPEAQVLGVRVRDDVRWGIPPERTIDVEAHLARVGLSGFADRETATLSGGELQRLAVAAARARDPQLLVSDEATSMLDPDGRRELMDLLRRLSADGLTIVHVTHDADEARKADRTIALAAGRLTSPDGLVHTGSSNRARPNDRRRERIGEPLSLRNVGHVYSAGTPWAHRGLERCDLEIEAGSGVVIAGRNGSGKSTLAWILAGLLVPSEGRAHLGERPVDQQVGRVGLSFQHARLQLLHRVVERDICAAAGVDPEAAHAALISVGLDPGEFAHREIEQLSGGEQRRVAIAGMLARRTPALVLDEPFAGLDHDSRAQLVDVLSGLRSELGVTLVVISHDEAVLSGVAERLIRLEAGRIVEDRGPSGSVQPEPAEQ